MGNTGRQATNKPIYHIKVLFWFFVCQGNIYHFLTHLCYVSLFYFSFLPNVIYLCYFLLEWLTTEPTGITNEGSYICRRRAPKVPGLLDFLLQKGRAEHYQTSCVFTQDPRTLRTLVYSWPGMQTHPTVVLSSQSPQPAALCKPQCFTAVHSCASKKKKKKAFLCTSSQT